MLTGLIFTLGYIVYFKFLNPGMNSSLNWLWGISPEGIGTIGMLINVFVSVIVSMFTSNPPSEIEDLIDSIRQP
jgi:cation/acetate symporter